MISVPPGWISSAARKPVSPMPAASSSTVWPGWGSIASTIQVETGIALLRSQSACASQPSAVVAQRRRFSWR